MKFIRKILFRRIVLISFVILAQLIVLIGIILKFNDYFIYFYGISILINITVVLGIINNRSKPDYKMAWIVTIFIIPIFGGLFYIFCNLNKPNKRRKKYMKSIGDKMREELTPQQFILDEMRLQNETAYNHSKYIQDYAYCPPYNNTVAEYLLTGEVKFERLKEELKKAKKYIFLEYFIIQEGVMWDSILEILVEKASMGIDVRVIYDDVGCLLTLPYRYDKKLEKMGIKCCIFNSIIPVLSTRLNNRDHRKITIIDGHTGFTGGINLADEYINKIEKHGYWKDNSIMIKGDAVWSLTVMFLTMWDYLRGIDEDFKRFKKTIPLDNIKDRYVYIQPFTDSPLDDEDVGERVYLNLINKARKYVYITTPYLIIDNEMITALSSAAKGGVDIRIITPQCGDNWFVHEVTRSYYKILIESGVKIYEYTPGFIHSKSYVVDDEYGVIGTINMDYRSFYLQFECGILMYNCRSIIDMKDDFINTLEICTQITINDFNKVKWYRILIVSVLRVFAPLM